MTKPSALNGRLTKWAMLLSQYDMQFLPQKAIKGQSIADFLAKNPRADWTKMHGSLPNETVEAHSMHATPQVWELYFDDASRTSLQGISIAGVGDVLISPHDHVTPRAFFRTRGCTNN